MMTAATIVAIISGIALLTLNWRAFQGDADAAGHGSKQKIQMAAIWALILAGLTMIIGQFQS
ncbi:MAG: hypothetical protein ABL912_10205 [Novosphingobium sp.]